MEFDYSGFREKREDEKWVGPKGIKNETVDAMLIPFDLILIAKENPHIDWNEQMRIAVEFYEQHPDECGEGIIA